MSILLYFLKVFLYSGILFGYYYLFLRNRRFHHYNRYFLLATLVLSVVLPFIKIPVFNEGPGVLNQAIYQTVSIVSVPPSQPVATEALPRQEASWFTLTHLSWLLYTAGALVLLLLFFRSLWYIRQIARRYPYELVKHLKFYQTQEPGTPFSFFSSVFWNSQLDFNSREGQQVFRHELFHVQQKHSADIILAELVTMAGWFNPFFYLIRKELKAIHEFLADQYATSGSDRYAYAEMLVHSIVKSRNLPLTHPFFQNHVKRRITMIIKHNNNRYGYWSRLMILPISLLLFFSLALYAGEKKNTPTPPGKDVAIDNAPVAKDTVPFTDSKSILQLKLQAEKEEVHNRQLILQKILAEKNEKDKNEQVNLILQKELTELKIKEEAMQEVQNKVMNLQLKKETERQQIQQMDLKLAMENEKKSLEVRELQLKSAKENNQAYQKELQIIQQKKEMLEKITREDNTNINITIDRRADSTVQLISKLICKTLRYPSVAANSGAGGVIYYSIEIDEQGTVKHRQTYDELPAEANGKVSEIVSVTYPKTVNENASEEAIKKSFHESAGNLFGQDKSTIFKPGGVAPGIYFFKLVFRVERSEGHPAVLTNPAKGDLTYEKVDKGTFFHSKVFMINVPPYSPATVVL
jgi:beta-lactamase regulating signal transducer with metallopeptidase domain